MKHRTYDNELTLISVTYNQDTIGNPIPHREETKVLCCVDSVKRSEFYNAATEGLHPECVFTLHRYEYGGQRLVLFNEIEYTVIRTYAIGVEEIELTVERKLRDGAYTN